MRPEVEARWRDACTAAVLFAIDPIGTGGIRVRAAAGPARDAWLDVLRAALPAEVPIRRVPTNVPDGRLLGGLDLTATLRSGRPVIERGLLADLDGGVALLAMAERLEPATAARLLAVLDTGELRLERDGLAACLPTRFGVVALDEGIGADERPAAGLLDRLAFHVELDPIDLAATRQGVPGREPVLAARTRLCDVTCDDDTIEALCAAGLAFGIASVRAPLLALRVARAAAALADRTAVTAEDAALAARLVLAPRATTLPVPEDSSQDEPEPPPDREPDDAHGDTRDDEHADRPLEDVVLEATRAAIPAGLLAALRAGSAERTRSQAAGRAGATRLTGRRGRPAGTRRGELRAGVRLNVVETLRAAAPWQPLRRRMQSTGSATPRRVEVRSDDFRIARYKERSQTTSIFIVDASGSSAMHRLAEAKGAVELLLADCYVRRDQVALVAFRGQAAELLLPPTRSLVRAKRGLAGLPGGGGTPLASALKVAFDLGMAIRRRGDTPVLIVLTDGHANIALDGTQGRQRAVEDATALARGIARAGLTSLLIDTSPRPRPLAATLARDLGARYLPLPHADARALSSAVRTATQTGPALPAHGH